jgi:tetratricopeptide (TPR) repeat protein
LPAARYEEILSDKAAETFEVPMHAENEAVASPDRTGQRGSSQQISSAGDAGLKTMKAEIDALQIAMSEGSKPWYRQPSVLIACIALVFSFSTTFYANRRAHKEDVHNAKVELRELIQRLTAIPQRNVDLDVKYAKDPNALVRAGSLLNTEQIVLAKQALDIIDEIPNEVSATEYYAVATALSIAGTYDRTLGLFQRAFEVAQDANDWLAAARSLGTAGFAQGDLKRGRAGYQQALNVFERFPNRNKAYVERTNAYTEMFWASSEVSAKQCNEAKRHASQAAQLDKDAISLAGAPDGRFSSEFRVLNRTLSSRCE